MSQKTKLLDLAMNLNRVGNWAADDYKAKRKRISFFLNQTTEYLNSLSGAKFPLKVKVVFSRFLKDYPRLLQEGQTGPKDQLLWAETMMTWGNILTHRSRLIK